MVVGQRPNEFQSALVWLAQKVARFLQQPCLRNRAMTGSFCSR